MKIAFMFYDGGYYKGGPLNNAINLLPEFKKRGHEVLALILAFKGESIAAPIFDELNVDYRIKKFPDYRELLMSWVLGELKIFSPDVFVPNICLSGLFASKYVVEAGIPCIAAHRSDDFRNWEIASTFGYGSEFRLSGLVCVSRFLEQETIKRSGTHLETKVIPSGINVNSSFVQKKNDRFKLVYSGRLVSEQKRVHEILEIFIMVVRAFPEVQCAFLGTGNELENLKAEIRNEGLEANIKLLGYQSGKQYRNTLKEYDAIILYSSYEGTPGSLMDGMSKGLVPISSQFNGVDELVKNKENGFIINNLQEAFDAISILINDQNERFRLAGNAHAHIKENYSIQECTSRWEAFMSALVEQQKLKPKTKIKTPKSFREAFNPNLVGNEPPFPYPWFRFSVLRKNYTYIVRINKKALHLFRALKNKLFDVV